MTRHSLLLIAFLSLAVPAFAQDADYARQVAQERKQAEIEAPQLAEVLGLQPGMTVADIGTGGGAMAIVLAKWIGHGRVFATDVTQRSLTITRDYAKKENLTNVTVIEGGAASTNLPDACCDAMFLRNVYHHVTAPADFNTSMLASLKPGGRLAIIDFEDRSGGKIPEGAPSNRGGHGVPPGITIEELAAAGFVHVRTIDAWPPGSKSPSPFLTLFRKK